MEDFKTFDVDFDKLPSGMDLIYLLGVSERVTGLPVWYANIEQWRNIFWHEARTISSPKRCGGHYGHVQAKDALFKYVEFTLWL